MSPKALAKLHDLEFKHGGTISKVPDDDPELVEVRSLISNSKQYGSVRMTEREHAMIVDAVKDGDVTFYTLSKRLARPSDWVAKALREVRVELNVVERPKPKRSRIKISHDPNTRVDYLTRLLATMDIGDMTRVDLADALNADTELMKMRENRKITPEGAYKIARYRGYTLKRIHRVHRTAR
ncbi:hypothetical protein [Secundilactobacillus kimchicus]|uniref:hypothetical protein n=1 Tax=Secundilactobacillus kimchicus TaxID=528209 RepID=UPI0024A93C80|nr:hypothetical protein [Secundilactobacillus kimchicus]